VSARAVVAVVVLGALAGCASAPPVVWPHLVSAQRLADPGEPSEGDPGGLVWACTYRLAPGAQLIALRQVAPCREAL
jgi:hypothetical protein